MKKIMFMLTLVNSFTLLSTSYVNAQTTEVKTKINTSHKGKSAAIGAGVGAVSVLVLGPVSYITCIETTSIVKW